MAAFVRLLGRLADWIENHVPVDLFDIDWPGDEEDVPPTADIDCMVAGCRWGPYPTVLCECRAA